ncbi:MAG TPA: AAA family ATPase, partial [Ktedonobacteraceae bacterium]|nr:AAA family ATPase [Ktedonobacteraceae bacterium]
RGAHEEEVHHSVLPRLQQAANLYRGNFLEGFYVGDAPSFEDWVGTERQFLHRRMDAIFHRLSQVQFERGEINDAIETTTRWVSHDPFNELVYRRLMQMQVATGDRTAALQTYETCRAMLTREFNTRPAPETEALAERIRVKDIPRRRLPPQRREPSRATTRARGFGEPSASTSAVEPPLIGRGKEHNTLVRLYHTARSGGPQVAVLTGEAGIGKTRLATEFLGWATAQGADVLAGRAFEAGGRLPYHPLVEALRGRLARENAPGDLLATPWLAELSQLLPELHERFLDLPSPSHDEAMARTRLFESVTRLGQALARRAPLILFIDGLQWADPSSLDLLHYVSRRFAENKSPVLLLCNLRSESLAITSELSDWLSGLGRDLPVTRLALDPLTIEETVQLIRSLTPEEVSGLSEDRDTERFGRWLYAETGGQPFFITETLKTLVERGIVTVQLAGNGVQTIDVVPALHYERGLRGVLPAGVREVIRSRLARLAPNALLLLTAGSALGGNFSFEWLCQVAGISEQLTRQSDGDAPQAAKGKVAVAPSDLRHLYLQLGWAYELRSEFAQAHSIYEEMLALAREMHEPVMECVALNRLATLAAQSNQDVARAEELLQQALTIAERSGNTAGVAETAWNLAQTGFYAGKIAASLPHAERALALAQELNRQELIGRSLH